MLLIVDILPFSVHTANVGLDEVHAIVQKDGRVIQSQVVKNGVDQSSVTFTPEIAGLYNVNVFVGGVDVQGKNSKIMQA